MSLRKTAEERPAAADNRSVNMGGVILSPLANFQIAQRNIFWPEYIRLSANQMFNSTDILKTVYSLVYSWRHFDVSDRSLYYDDLLQTVSRSSVSFCSLSATDSVYKDSVYDYEICVLRVCCVNERLCRRCSSLLWQKASLTFSN